MASPVHPWQEEAWARLGRIRAAGRLPHAILVSGPAGTGVRGFADTLAQSLLCEQPPEHGPCGACRGCRLFGAGTHPDASRLEPAETGKAIPVEAVRALGERLMLTGDGTKIAIIDPADAMTTAAANSLLKTLEEPAGGAILLLVSRRAARLPATVRSRCQRVTFGLPGRGAALEWLAAQDVDDPEAWLARAGGAPLAALELARAAAESGAAPDAAADALLFTLETGRLPGGISATAASMSLASAVPALAATVEDLLKLRHAPGEAALRRPDQRARLEALANRLDARALFDYLDTLYRAIPGASSSLRADIQLQGLLADAARMAGTPRVSPGRR